MGGGGKEARARPAALRWRSSPLPRQPPAGGSGPAVPATPPSLPRLPLPQAPCSCPSSQTLSLGCSEETEGPRGRAARQGPGRCGASAGKTSLPGAPFLPLRAGRQWDPWQHPDGCRTPGPRPVSPQRWRPPGTRCRCAHLLWCRQRGSRYDLLGPCPPQGEGIVPGPSEMPQPFLQQTFAFSVRWSDNSDTFARRSWDEFRGLHVSKRGNPGFPLR